MTALNSAMFDDGWQKILGISYDRLEWSATGERLNEATFRKYRAQPGMVIMHMIPDDIVSKAVAHPLTIIASDGIITGGKGHPRGAGTFARTLGYWVRDRQALPLMEAIRKMSLLPAQRIETYIPAMKNKGRIKIGADADLVLFDPAKVKDEATFQNPAQYSTGIPHVIVAGVPVVANGAIQPKVFPGKAIRAAVR
jgi:dihydroorotase